MLIGVSGLAGAGKDEVAKILVRDHGFVQKALATKMKEAALALDPIIDWTDPGPHGQLGVRSVRLSELIEKLGPEKAKEHPEVRRLYQRMGTEVGRKTIDPGLWVKLVFQGIRKTTDLVISDVRFVNELSAISSREGYVWRIVRPGAGLEGQQANHVSEKELHDDGLYYDYVLYNDGTLEDLAKKVASALYDIKHG